MVRIHDEPVEVVRHDDTPVQFLLRERLFVVRTVLAHWVEPGGWRWVAPVWGGGEDRRRPAGDPPGEDRPAGAEVPGSLPTRRPGAFAPMPERPPAPPASGTPVARAAATDVAERELWRVEAAAGRSYRPDIFDLCRIQEQPRWTVSRVEE